MKVTQQNSLVIKPRNHVIKENQVNRREYRDFSFTYTVLGLIIFFIFTLALSYYFLWRDTILGSEFFVSLVLLLGLGFLVGIGLLPLYCLFLLFVKNYLIKLFYILPPTMAILLLVVDYSINKTVYTLPASIILLLVYSYILIKFKNQFNLASLTSRNFLILSENYKFTYLKVLLKAVAVTSGILLLLLVSIFFSILFIFGIRTSKVGDKFYLFLVFLVFSLVSIYFIIKVLGSASYVYGAATFDQYSLSLVPENNLSSKGSKRSFFEPVSSRYLEDAYEIAFRKSFGSACYAAANFGVSDINEKMEKKNKGNPSALWGNLDEAEKLEKTYKGSIASSALLYAAMYGEPLVECGKMAIESFTSNGLQRLLSVQLIGNLLDYIAFVFACGISIAGNNFLLWFYKKPLSDQDMWGPLFILNFGIICGFVSLVSVNGYVTGGSNVQLSIFIEDPERFEGKYRKLSHLKKYMAKFHRKARK